MFLQHLKVDWKPAGRAVGFKRVKRSRGVGMPAVPQETGAEAHTASVLSREQTMFKPLTVRGSGRRAREWC